MITYIALTALESHWESPNNTLLLGEWCRKYDGSNNWQNYSTELLSHPWLNHLEMELAESYCNKLTEEFAIKLAERLEERLRLNQPYRFYERIFWPWLLQFTQMVYDRYVSILDALKVESNICFLVAKQENLSVPARGTIEFTTRYVDDDRYNLSLYSDIVSFLGLPRKETQLSSLPSGGVPGDWGVASLTKKEILNKLLYSLCSLGQTKVWSRAYLNKTYADFLKQFRGRWIIDNYIMPPSRTSLNLDWKFRQNSLLIKKDVFSSLLSTLIPMYIPWGMFEALPSLVDWAKQHPARKAKVFITSQTANSIPLFCLAGVSGRPVVVYSHGGGSGTFLKCSAATDYDLRVADVFFSPAEVPSPMLDTSHVPTSKPGKAILVCNDVYRYSPRFMSGFMSSGAKEHYHDFRIEFLRAIPSEKLPIVRLYFKEFGWNVRNNLINEIKGIVFQESTQMLLEENVNCPLFILDHPLTTFHKCMAANRPVMVFCSPKIYFYKPEAEPIMDALTKAGIYHINIGVAAKHYLSVVDDVSDWWNSREVQSARELFCSKYALAADNWPAVWDVALSKIAANY